MKKALLTIFLFLSLLSLAAINPVVASGVNDLQVSKNGDVIYITTEQSATNSSTTTTVTTAPSNQIVLPKGFFSDATSLINNVLRIVLIVAALLVFAFLILGGFEYITSGGEKGKTEAARNKIVSAIIGLVILAASYAILTLVLRFLGYRDLNELVNNIGTVNQVIITPTPTPVATTSSPLQILIK